MAYISSMKDTKDLSITVYNNDFGIVKEKREVSISENECYIQYLDVAQMIETDSIIISGLDVLELNYDYDLVSKEKLLEKYLDKTVIIYNKDENTSAECRLLSISGGIVLEKSDTKEIILNPSGEVILPKLPGELIVRPALVWKVKPSESNEIGISYLTKGFRWKAQYVINLKEDRFDLDGWVNIENNSGMTFENVHLKLIAGEVRRVKQYMGRNNHHDIVAESNNSYGTEFKEESFSDYHMYTLKGCTTLKNNQSKQISFIKIDNIHYKKYYEYTMRDSGTKIIIEFENKKDSCMGIPLPKGVVKAYTENKNDSSLEFIGENTVNHTPIDEKVKLLIGEAFDIKCDGVRIECNKDEEGNEYHTYNYNIYNHKDEEITVKLNHYVRNLDWQMVYSSEEYIKEDFTHIIFWINVKPDENKTIEFQYKFNDDVSVKIK